MLGFAVGHSVSYLTGPVASGREGYYTGAVDTGEPAGRWYGAGAEALGLTGEVNNDLMTAVYTHFLDPTDPATQSQAMWGEARTLGFAAKTYRTPDQIYKDLLVKEPNPTPERRAELQAQAESCARESVAFYDMTFSPAKSVTVLAVAFERMANDSRAAGDEKAAAAWASMQKAVEDAVMAGARASIDHLQKEGGYSREGKHGGNSGRWGDAHNFVVAQFLQHDSREKDPQLHVHQAILNKTMTADGKWVGVDGAALRMLKGAAGAVGERVMEAHLSRVLGVQFATRPDGKAREIVGVSKDVMDLFSTRSRQVNDRAAKVVREFTDHIGREPSALELSRIRQEAALSTRKAKSHTPEPLGERLDRWERECRQALVGGLAQVAREALRPVAGARERWSVREILDKAIDRVADKKQSWTRGDLMRAVSDVLPANLRVAPEKVERLLESIADEALGAAVRITPEERTDDLTPELILANGKSVYARPCGAKWAAPGGMAAEYANRAAAIVRGAEAITAEEADAAVARFAENGHKLYDDQAAAMRGVLTSGAMVEAINAPAGTGKSFTVGAIADAWKRSTGRSVYGLAPSQVAADVLADEGLQSWNTTAWLGGRDVPPLQAGDIVVVDEAGMASTADLAAVIERCRVSLVKVLLVGDKRQLAAVGAGGGFADIAQRALDYELTEVRRFTATWERTASLRLREGDKDVLAEYDRNGRIRVGGTQEQAASAAVRAWLADTVDGREALLVVGSNEDAAKASAELRVELVRLGRVEAAGVQLGKDGNTAGVGDLVQGRLNAWDLKGWEGNGRVPINRQGYRVVALREDGGLTVEPAKGGATIQLPRSYVAEHLTLAYASTVHAAEGRTVDTAHGVVSAGTAAGALYVQLTRGRDGNTAWVVTRKTDQEMPVGEAQDVEHRAAKAVLADILDRAEDERSAVQEKEDEEERAASVATAIERLSDEVAMVTAGRTSNLLDLAAATGEITDEQRVAIAADPAMRGLERVLRQAEVAGHDPAEVLGRALQGRSLDTASSPAAVLHHRIRETTRLDARLQSASDLLPQGLSEAWQTRLSNLAEDADNRRRELGAEVVAKPPPWAVEALGVVPEDVVGRAEWESRAGWAAAHRELMGHEDETEPIGAAPAAGLVEKHAFWRTAHVELDLPDRSPEEAGLPDGFHRNRIAAWDRERVWAPRYVGDELSATSERAAQLRTDSTLWAERADTEDLPDVERDQLREAAAKAAKEAVELAERVELLEVADKARARWYLHTAPTRDKAERSRSELGARGVDLVDPGDVVDSDEWLAARAEDLRIEDPHRAIHDDDLVDVDTVDPTGAVKEAVTDIRATAIPDPDEFSDEPHARRVPSADEAVADVERSREALLEIEARNAADAWRESEEAAEEARRAQWRDEQAAVEEDVDVRVS